MVIHQAGQFINFPARRPLIMFHTAVGGIQVTCSNIDEMSQLIISSIFI